MNGIYLGQAESKVTIRMTVLHRHWEWDLHRWWLASRSCEPR